MLNSIVFDALSLSYANSQFRPFSSQTLHNITFFNFPRLAALLDVPMTSSHRKSKETPPCYTVLTMHIIQPLY